MPGRTRPTKRTERRARQPAGAVKDALVAAVIRLLDARSAADISVRDIAREAGVNHGLVHRHFGSKERLLREAVARTSALVVESRPAVGHTVWCAGLLRERPEIARIVARCCLDGPRDLLELASPPREVLEQFVAPGKAALRRLGLEGALDPYVLNAVGVAAILGWIVFKPLLETRYGLPPDAEEKVTQLAALVDAIVAGTASPTVPAALPTPAPVPTPSPERPRRRTGTRAR